MRNYFLRSARLGFGRWQEGDLALVLGLWGDPEVTRWIGGPFSDEEVAARLAQAIETDRALGLQYWPIFLLEGGAHAGCAGLRPYRPNEGILELGVHLRTEHWGKGLATEAARAAIAHAFTDLDA